MKCKFSYKNIWEDITQRNKTTLYDTESFRSIVLNKLCCKNKTRGTAIKPENETALPISITSLTIFDSGSIKNWKKIRKKREVNIAIIIFVMRSRNEELYILKIFKNSTGINKTKSDTQKRIKNQNNPCAFHVITCCSIIPIDSIRRYTE